MSLIENLLRRFRFVRRLERKIGHLEQTVSRLQTEAEDTKMAYPPGHFYSPLPSRAEVAEVFSRGGFGPPFPGINLNESHQLRLLEEFAATYAQMPFPETARPGWRFHLSNPSYGAFDAIMLWSMLRHAQTRRVIEVGSGYSSAAMLDLNEHVFGRRLSLTFIDPDMGRLRPLLKPDDLQSVTLIEKRVQDVPLSTFASLVEGDVLFIDSSHVSKLGSDVNHLFFQVLPLVRPGVYVHIHDVAGNFEYPRSWFEEGRAWNEQYLLRAFLMHNTDFEIVLFSGWLFNRDPGFFQRHMPLCASGGGGQIWIRRVQDGLRPEVRAARAP